MLPTRILLRWLQQVPEWRSGGEGYGWVSLRVCACGSVDVNVNGWMWWGAGGGYRRRCSVQARARPVFLMYDNTCSSNSSQHDLCIRLPRGQLPALQSILTTEDSSAGLEVGHSAQAGYMQLSECPSSSLGSTSASFGPKSSESAAAAAACECECGSVATAVVGDPGFAAPERGRVRVTTSKCTVSMQIWQAPTEAIP